MTGYDLSRLSFLVADDNAFMRTIIKSVLHALGVRTIAEAESGSDAFARVRQDPFDIVTCDWEMMPLDGIGFVRLVRTSSDSPDPALPIIMLTGYSEIHHVVAARDAGATEYLAKPISAKSLYSRIVSVIETPRPFVRVGSYVGPSRRRRNRPIAAPERRQWDACSAAPAFTNAPRLGLGQSLGGRFLRE